MSPPTTRIGFIGLGVMGEPMAANLLKQGHRLSVHNRSQAPVRRLTLLGAHAHPTPASVTASTEVVITMLPDTPDVEAVYFGPQGILQAVKTGHLLIDMSTVEPAMARRIHEAACLQRSESVDAPVSGGHTGAVSGTLSIMVGATSEGFARAEPVLSQLGSRVVHVGLPGAGQVAEACNQLIVGITLQAVAEAFVLANKSGVDAGAVREALLGGFAASRVLDHHGLRALSHQDTAGFRMALQAKDLAIALNTAEALGVDLPLTQAVSACIQSALDDGLEDLDHSALIGYWAARHHVTFPTAP